MDEIWDCIKKCARAAEIHSLIHFHFRFRFIAMNIFKYVWKLVKVKQNYSFFCFPQTVPLPAIHTLHEISLIPCHTRKLSSYYSSLRHADSLPSKVYGVNLWYYAYTNMHRVILEVMLIASFVLGQFYEIPNSWDSTVSNCFSHPPSHHYEWMKAKYNHIKQH